MSKVYVAAGHSQNTDIPQRLYEWERCMRAEEECVRLLRDSGVVVVVPDDAMRTMANNEALRAKVQQCNEGGCDLAVELHLNAGGGSYATNIFWDDKDRGRSSSAGEELSREIAMVFDAGLEWEVRYGPQSDYDRELYFLGKTSCPSSILEPAFKDFEAHVAWIDAPHGMITYGAMTYLGILNFLRERGEVV
tara:strand:- start:22643 stop:23218 length:576 start_codon:yes stop_codon:yes gene_type:complete